MLPRLFELVLDIVAGIFGKLVLFFITRIGGITVSGSPTASSSGRGRSLGSVS
jgi:hypothetical protein